MNSGLLNQVLAFCRKHTLLAGEERLVLGVSGGPDSLCLLHLLLALRDELELTLTVAHLDHQLRGPESRADADFVNQMATRWQLPCFIQTRNVRKLATQRKQSIEEAARQARYAFLWQIASQVNANKIAVGHNADDQVETVLMHFLRGTGLAGLRGMLPKIDIDTLRLHPDDTVMTQPGPQLIRPLLDITRAQIEAYCQENDLMPRRDYTNQDTTYFRNRLRHELIPQLETYNPNIRQVIHHTASVVAADTEILSNQLDEAWQQIVKKETAERIEFHLQPWLRLPLALKRSTLRRAVQTLRHSLRDVSFDHIENAIEILEREQTGAKATLPQGLLLSVSYQAFTVTLRDAHVQLSELNYPHLPKGEMIPVKLPGTTALPPGQWQLSANFISRQGVDIQTIKQAGPWEAYLNADVMGQETILRTRRPGDTFCPLGMGGHRQKVNEFMINQKIPARWRNHIPLFVSDSQILWVCGYRPDERARVKVETRQVLHVKVERV